MDQRMSPCEHYERGLVLKKVRMYYQAIDDFRQAALDSQYTGKAYLQIALCLRAAGRQDEAVMAFRQAVASPAFTSEEQRHILYHMGLTLESLGRHAECLEVYGWIRKEDPGFRDVTQRIKRLTTGGRGPTPRSHIRWHGWMQEVLTRGRQLKPQMESFLEQTGEWLRRRTETLASRCLFDKRISASPVATIQPPRQAFTATRHGQPAPPPRTVNMRRYARVPVRLRSHFSQKGRTVAGEGELRDLSPWGCRVASAVAVPVGADLECCIFPQDAGNPFVIEGATVRWTGPQEFGVAFTNVRRDVQRQIARLCRTRTV